MKRDALLSACGQFRFTLTRQLNDYRSKGFVLWVMLNPSTADASIDDRTIETCCAFTHAWGYDGLLVGNAYAFRATDPKMLKRAGYPRGPGNDVHLRALLRQSTLTVAAWGTNIEPARESEMLALLRAVRPVHYLALTKGGHPSHPLYKPRNLRPTELI